MNVRPASVSNSAGFGVNETSRMPLAAVPASNFPALSPLRGSLPVGKVCATSVGATASVNIVASAYILRAFPISRCSMCGLGDLLSVQHLVHGVDLRGLHGLDVVREDRHVHVLRRERCGEEVRHHLERTLVVL